MRKPALKRLTVALRQLTPVQRKIVSAELASLDAQPASTVIIESRFAPAASCPHCESRRVIRHGHANGLQRYRCRECSKTFSALTGTPLCGLHKRGKWLDQAMALRDGLTLHQVADALCIHVSTAHRWRHRFLAQPQTVQPRVLTGIAEADETMFLLSFKGKRSGLERKARRRGGRAAKRGLSHEQVPVLVARDRSGATMDCVLKAMDITTLSAALKPFLTRDVVLCTDGSSALAGAARKLGVEHHAVNLSAGIRVDGAWHVQNVNAYHSRLKSWVYKFRGVATCYLENYLGWFRAMDREPPGSTKPAHWLAMALGREE
ncbi:MAG: IS1595 family transposase [Pseudomonadota bacterium]|nr:IS1595 family transposase [Pseudomonadota bacterium]MDP1905289.1 IS1595 family transposase [Pseudomonadota bacterium]MDP2353841.1 IS1595 family transposase [Pseudomonadota bacterium]